MIARNASKSFFPEKVGLYSKWLLESNGTFTFCRYYPGEIQLAVVANNPGEQMMRTEFLEQEPDRELALASFAQHLVRKIRAS
jgi:hypothetical protein